MIVTTVTKHIDIEGIIVIGSDKVSDEALYAAKDIVLKLTSKYPQIRRELEGYECRLVAPGESVASYLDLDENNPIYAFGCSLPPTNNFLGRCASVIEWDNEPNMGVFTHQFAYAIMYVMPRFSPNFLHLLNQAYGRAKELGTWEMNKFLLTYKNIGQRVLGCGAMTLGRVADLKRRKCSENMIQNSLRY